MSPLAKWYVLLLYPFSFRRSILKRIFFLINTSSNICGTLGDLVLFGQFKRSEGQPWSSVTFSEVEFTKSNNPPWMFFTYFKLYKIPQRISFSVEAYFDNALLQCLFSIKKKEILLITYSFPNMQILCKK